MAEKRQIGIPDEPLDYTSDFITKPYDLDDTRGYEDQKHEVLSGELKRTVVGENWKIPSQTQERRPQVVQALEGLERGIGDIIKGFLPQEQIKWRTDPVGAAAGWGAALSAPVLVGGAALVEGAESMFPETLGTLKPKESKELTREKLEQVWEDTLQKESQKLEKARTDLESGKISQGQYDAMEKQFDTLVGRRQKAFENIDKYNATVQALDGTPYPNAKIADAVVSESARYLQMRELNNAIEMAQKGIDPESTGFKIGSLAGPTAILGAIGFGGNYLSRYGLSGALRRITTDVETEGGAARLAAIKPVRSRRQAARAGMTAVEVGTEEMESAQYVWENVQDYIERTGDKTLEYFTPQDAKAFTASAYGAIAGKIETMGGIENIAAGAFRRLGVGGFGRRVLATGGEEWAEEGLQNLTEYLSRRIDGTTDKTLGEALEDALNAAVWGGFMGIGFGTIGGVTYRNARKQGIKTLQEAGYSRETAEKVFDIMIEQTTDAISPRNEPVRENIRQKVALIYEGKDLSPAELEDTIEATTDLDLAMIAYDSQIRGIDINEHPLLNSVANNIGWFRDGIPEQISDQVAALDEEIGNLRRQLAEENAKEKPDMDKIDDLEAKIEQFYAKLPKEVSDLVETDRQKIRQMLAEQSAELQARQAQRRIVQQVQKRATSALQRAQESDVQKSLRRLEQESKTEEKKAKETERQQRTQQRKLRKAIEKLRQNMTKRKNNLPLSQELFADADLVYQALRDSGFTDQQIATMAEEDIVKAVAPYGISKKTGNILKQSKITGKGADTARGFYVPEYRLVVLTQQADPTTAAHEFAHDWLQQFFRYYRSGKANESFMKSWGAVEKALGITENDITVPEKASEAFARAFEAWVENKEDWTKGLDIDDDNRDRIIETFKRYQGYLTDIYEDLNNPYFLDTWGETGKLKPELQAWFDKVTIPTDLISAQVAAGVITPEQAKVKAVARDVTQIVQAAEDNFTQEEKDEINAIERINDTKRYEVEGGNKNSLQNRLSGLARDIDANNIALGRYDTHRDMLAVAKAADEFVRTRRDEALNIINGLEPEKEGLYASDLYTALERLATETNDVDLALELVNSKVAKDLAKEWGQRVAGFRNFTGDGDFDAVSAVKSLDNKYKKDFGEEGKERIKTASDEFLAELNKTDDAQDLDSFFDSVKCQ